MLKKCIVAVHASLTRAEAHRVLIQSSQFPHSVASLGLFPAQIFIMKSSSFQVGHGRAGAVCRLRVLLLLIAWTSSHLYLHICVHIHRPLLTT